MAKHDQMDRVVNLAKRRGLVFPSSEIYGGFRSTWDYGPLGVLLKRNVKDAWWRAMVQLRDDIVGLDAAVVRAGSRWLDHHGFESDDISPKACWRAGTANAPHGEPRRD